MRWFSVVRRTVTTEEMGGMAAGIEEGVIDIGQMGSDTM
jgi:hypothetical protein